MSQMRAWLYFDEATAIVRERLSFSVGRSKSVVRQAKESGEVDWALAPIADELFPVERDWMFSKDDFIDWFDRFSSTTKRAASGQKDQARAREAAQAEWGKDGPPPHLRNDEIVRIGNKRLKLMGQREVSPSTWMRAVGKKKK